MPIQPPTELPPSATGIGTVANGGIDIRKPSRLDTFKETVAGAPQRGKEVLRGIVTTAHDMADKANAAIPVKWKENAQKGAYELKKAGEIAQLVGAVVKDPDSRLFIAQEVGAMAGKSVRETAHALRENGAKFRAETGTKFADAQQNFSALATVAETNSRETITRAQAWADRHNHIVDWTGGAALALVAERVIPPAVAAAQALGEKMPAIMQATGEMITAQAANQTPIALESARQITTVPDLPRVIFENITRAVTSAPPEAAQTAVQPTAVPPELAVRLAPLVPQVDPLVAQRITDLAGAAGPYILIGVAGSAALAGTYAGGRYVAERYGPQALAFAQDQARRGAQGLADRVVPIAEQIAAGVNLTVDQLSALEARARARVAEIPGQLSEAINRQVDNLTNFARGEAARLGMIALNAFAGGEDVPAQILMGLGELGEVMHTDAMAKRVEADRLNGVVVALRGAPVAKG